MDNFYPNNYVYNDKACEDDPMDFMLPQQDPFNMSQNVLDFGNAMFSSIGMKGNIHSALFNPPIPKQLSFSNEPFTFEPKPKFINPVTSSPPYIGFRPQAPAEFSNPYSTHSIYSSSGFNLLSILSYLVNRPNPTINIGPVDLSCAFLLVDACKQDFPIVYSSPAFQTLTGYDTHEVVGRNCRFLQSPDGNVSSGSRRKFVDNQQIFTIKNQLLNAKETQTSLVNYRKNGQPFINLLTMIPIFENGAVVFFVGLQIDMVEQPNAIIENMSGGKYALNYGVPTFTKLIKPEEEANELKDLFGSNMKPPKVDNLETYSQAENDWTRMLLENTSDFLHVISLKGSFLYASPNSKALFGHVSSELEGSSLEKFCHPGDLISVLRDLREAAAIESHVSLVYRFKIAGGGYVWMESTGKINSDLGKGRRCVIMTGRIRPVYQLSRELMLSCGGETSPNEYWSKVSPDGLILHVTPTCFNVLGYLPEELNGTSLYQFMHLNSIMSLTTSLDRASSGNVSHFTHQFQSKKGLFLDVNSIIYPGPLYPNSQKPAFFICRSKLVSTAVTESKEIYNKSSGDLFDVLSPNCSSSWQFELQLLRLQNRKLREEIDSQSPKNSNKRRASKLNRQCLACMRTSTAEWRRGPEGPSTLCNPCGLKYAKGISPYASSGSVSTSSGSTTSSSDGFFSSKSSSRTLETSSVSTDSLLTPTECQSLFDMTSQGSK